MDKIKCLFYLFLVSILFLHGDEKVNLPKQKNVLFLIVDDLNSWLLGDPNRYTGKVIAPNIKKLAESGVNFVNAHCASTVCTPSRTSVLTGVAPWKSGVYGNGYDILKSPSIKNAVSLPELFQKAGYYTAKSGKVGHGYGRSMKDFWSAEGEGSNKDPLPPNAPLNGWSVDKTGRVTSKDWGVISHIPKEEIGDWKYADFAIEQLQKDHDKPFFISCGIFRPHNPWYVPQEYIDRYPIEEIKIPLINEDDLSDLPLKGKELAQKSNMLATLREKNQYKEAIQHYLACTTFADEQIGRVLSALEASPYAKDTIVVLWSDHGWHLGEKLHWTKGTLWQESTHCLMMFKVPGMTQPGGQCKEFVSLLDIYPTLANLTNLKLPENQTDGVSLVEQLKNPDQPSLSKSISAINQHISIRTKNFRYIRYTDGGEEFYDCQKDPREWTNQINNPEYALEIKTLQQQIPTASEMVTEVGNKKDDNAEKKLKKKVKKES